MGERKIGDAVLFEYNQHGEEKTREGKIKKVLDYYYEVISDQVFLWEKPEDLVFYVKKTEVF